MFNDDNMDHSKIYFQRICEKSITLYLEALQHFINSTFITISRSILLILVSCQIPSIFNLKNRLNNKIGPCKHIPFPLRACPRLHDDCARMAVIYSIVSRCVLHFDVAASSGTLAFESIHLTSRYISAPESGTTINVGELKTWQCSLSDGAIDSPVMDVWTFCISLLVIVWKW